MKNRMLLLIVCLVALLLSSCVHTVNFIESNPIGKIYKDTINIRNMELPLPEGEWIVVGRGYARSDNYFQVCLNKINGKQIQAGIMISRDSLKNSYPGYKAMKDLNRVDIHHVVSNKNRTGEALDGWYINHTRLNFSGNLSQANKEALKYFKENKLTVPDNFIKINHCFTGRMIKKKYLNYALYLNPETEGFKPPTHAEWASSDWNILKINKDPKKVEYIEKQKKYGAVFHQKLRDTFGI